VINYQKVLLKKLITFNLLIIFFISKFINYFK